MRLHSERRLTVEQSLDIAEQTMRAYGLQVNAEAYGEELQTYRCKLTDIKNKKIFYGFGKGLGLQSKASAYYEALEHYAVHDYAQMIAADSHNYRELYPYPAALPCVDLSEFRGVSRKTMPIFAIDPRYVKYPAAQDKLDYQSYSAFVSDNGVASGTNFTEASIHALNELIERDAHSLFLIEGFVKQSHQAVRLIDTSTLPAHLQQIVATIEQQYNDHIMMFDVTSEFGIPVMYASMTQQPFLIQPSGCGASLPAEYALERALLEMLQPLHIHNESMVENQQEIIDVLRPYPLLLRAAVADVVSLAAAQTVSWASMSSPKLFQSLEEQLAVIVNAVTSRGFQIFHLEITRCAQGFTAVKYHIPELEQFHLVQTGKKILPGKRGQALLNKV